MNTKHTSKTLQERLERLNTLRIRKHELDAFHGAPRIKEDIVVRFEVGISPYSHIIVLSENVLFRAVEEQIKYCVQEIAWILEELGLEE